MTDKMISQGLKYIFLIHAIISVIFGLGLWLIPGSFLTLLGWVPTTVEFTVAGEQGTAPGTVFIDPFITRLLGAALLALAYSSFWGWRMNQWIEVKLVVQTEAVYCILALLGGIWAMIRYTGRIQPIAYVIVVLLAGFTVAWLWALRTHTRE
jgi:hypothetical protein